MDPKQNTQPLDPKLQEAYDKVMGTSVGGNDTSPVPGSAAPVNPISSSTPSSATPQMPSPTDSIPSAPDMSVFATPAAVPPATAPMQDAKVPLSTPPVTVTINQNPMQPPSPIPPATQPSAMPPMENTTAPTTHIAVDSAPSDESNDSLHATVTMPQVSPHATETVKIGLGGSPIASSTKAKSKGISPVIIILGAFAFLAVYAFFWIRFFNFSIPFLGK